MTNKKQQLATLEDSLKQSKAEFRFWKKVGISKEVKEIQLKNEEELVNQIMLIKKELEHTVH